MDYDKYQVQLWLWLPNLILFFVGIDGEVIEMITTVGAPFPRKS